MNQQSAKVGQGAKSRLGTLQIRAEENVAHLFLKFLEDLLKTVADRSAKEGGRQMQLGGTSNQSLCSSPRGRFQRL